MMARSERKQGMQTHSIQANAHAQNARSSTVTSPNENKKYKCVMSTFPNYNKSKK
jgi:hypothetical protein